MLNDDQVDTLMDIFYAEAPYNYVIAFEDRKPKRIKGVCIYDEKACIIYGTDDYYEALEVVLHELAHARIQHRTHSDVWEKELVRLMIKHKFPRELAGRNTIVGPNVREYMNG